MKVISIEEIRSKLADANRIITETWASLSEPDILIADIPVSAPVKKARKKRIKKEPTDKGKQLEAPKEKRKYTKKNPFGEPKLRPGETPI